jgi:uncharacterized membrane protein SirB2
MTKYLDDFLFLLGAALISIGAFVVYPVSTWFVTGFFCLLAGMLVARAQGGKA